MKSTPIKRRVGYARVSTDEQNLDLQIRALQSAGCEVIYTDKGISGGTRQRPGLDKALKALRRGDKLVVWRLDRLGRSLVHLVQMLDALGERKVRFHSMCESIDTSSSGGRLVFHMMAALAEFERSLISERTRAGMDAARARGQHVGRFPSLSLEQCHKALALLDQGVSAKSVAEHFDVKPRTLLRLVERVRPSPAACGEQTRSIAENTPIQAMTTETTDAQSALPPNVGEHADAMYDRRNRLAQPQLDDGAPRLATEITAMVEQDEQFVDELNDVPVIGAGARPVAKRPAYEPSPVGDHRSNDTRLAQSCQQVACNALDARLPYAARIDQEDAESTLTAFLQDSHDLTSGIRLIVQVRPDRMVPDCLESPAAVTLSERQHACSDKLPEDSTECRTDPQALPSDDRLPFLGDHAIASNRPEPPSAPSLVCGGPGLTPPSASLDHD